MARGEASELFTRDRDEGLASLLGNLDQTGFGEPAYPSVEAIAAHLLYSVVRTTRSPPDCFDFVFFDEYRGRPELREVFFEF